MPRKFMVKRNNNSGAMSYRVKDNTENEVVTKFDNFSEPEVPITRFGSPDSGYSCSPVNLIIREQPHLADAVNNNCEKDSVVSVSPVSSASHSPLSVSTTGSYPSPFYLSSFDKLSVCSNSPTNNLNFDKERQKNSPLIKSPSQNSPNKRRGHIEHDNKTKIARKPKAIRKINFDEDKSSPVSGCIITDEPNGEDSVGKVIYGDIDSSYNCVEVTLEAKAELEKIENKIGDYICKLCKEFYNDAFQLAQHRCSRIVHVEYRCPECDKVFSCPANLASHRRWHKPRATNGAKTLNPPRILPAVPNMNFTDDNRNKSPTPGTIAQNANILNLTVDDIRGSPAGDGGQYQCETCGKKFRRQAYLRKHVLNHVNDQKATQKQYSDSMPTNNNDSTKFSRKESTETDIMDNTMDVPCSLCNLTFQNKLAFEKHIKTHTSELFPCKYCTSTFYSSPGLTRHINKCHPSENRQVILLQLPTNMNDVHRPN